MESLGVSGRSSPLLLDSLGTSGITALLIDSLGVSGRSTALLLDTGELLWLESDPLELVLRVKSLS